MIPFGKAAKVREGSDLTLITYGALVPRALQAAQKAQREHGIRDGDSRPAHAQPL